VFLRVTPTASIGRALKLRKLTPRFTGSYQITRRIRPVAYEIALPPHLEKLHNVFHVSQFRKYVADPTNVLEQDDVQVREDLTMGVRPERILDSEVKQLREGDSDCEGSLGRGHSGDDLGDGGSHEEVLSSLFC